MIGVSSPSYGGPYLGPGGTFTRMISVDRVRFIAGEGVATYPTPLGTSVVHGSGKHDKRPFSAVKTPSGQL